MRSKDWLSVKRRKKKEHQPCEPPCSVQQLSLGGRVSIQLPVQHHSFIPEMGTTILTCIWVTISQPVWANLHPCAPLGIQYWAGLSRLLGTKLCRKERHSFSITVLLHVASADSKDHPYPLQAERFSFIPCPGQVKTVHDTKKPKTTISPLSANQQQLYAKLFKKRIKILLMPSCWNTASLFTAAWLSC